MGTTDSLNTLPIIDFANPSLNPGNPEWESVKSQVKIALEEYGCFQAMFKRPEDMEMIINFNILDELFELPFETKFPKEFEKPLHSYFVQLPHGPLLEGISVNDPTTLEKIESFVKLMWPQGNPHFSKNLNSFAEKVLAFHGILTKMILESLGVVEYLDELENSTYHDIGIQKYEEPRSGDAKVALKSHKDSNVMTILYQNKVSGLEIQTKNGDWILAAPAPNSFFVFVGESLDAWTNGRFHVPVHRVMVSGNERRYSIALFSFFKAGSIVKPPDELVNEEHPLMYKPFDYSEFRKYRKKNSEKTDLLELKSYCGV